MVDIFTHENIVEPLLDYYKDYSYVKEILEMHFEDGWKAYKKGIERINNDREEKIKEKYWDLFLLEIKNGTYKGTFEDYYNSKNPQKNTSLNVLEEEKRIKEKIRSLEGF